jgi:hypothetical protein
MNSQSPALFLALQTCMKTEQRENKEVSRWMSHSKHRITHSIAQGGQGNWWQGLNRSAGVRVIAGDVGWIGVVGILRSLRMVGMNFTCDESCNTVLEFALAEVSIDRDIGLDDVDVIGVDNVEKLVQGVLFEN